MAVICHPELYHFALPETARRSQKAISLKITNKGPKHGMADAQVTTLQNG